MGRNRELFEKFRNEIKKDTDNEDYFFNFYMETVTIGCIYKE
jgi:hypothetical protein